MALLWLGWRLIEQDRALTAQRLRDQHGQAADLIAASLEQALVSTRQRLDQIRPGEEDGVVVTSQDRHLESRPKLLFYPYVPARQAASFQLFAASEQLEFEDQDHAGAIAALRPLTKSPEASVRAGAHLRIARNLRKAGKPELALAEYDGMAKCGAAAVEGIPAELVGRRARLPVLQELGRSSELREEARALAADLRDGRWQLTHAAFLHFAEAAGYQPPLERLALAEAVAWWWEKRKTAPNGQERLTFDGQDLTVLWSGDHALVARAGYIDRNWLAPLSPLLKSQMVRLALDEPAPSGAIVRERGTTGLPWTLSVVSAAPDLEAREFALRRRTLLAGFGLLLLVVCAAGYSVFRAVHHELVAARLKSDFVAAVSHEFRTPLTLLRQITEILLEKRVATELDREAYYQAQSRATERLHRLVESMLDFRRMEAGARPYHLEPVDPGALVRRVVQEFESGAECNGYSVELCLPPSLPPVNADSEALAQAVWNLLDNARKYSLDQRSIQVDVASQGANVAIAVSDRGLGIPANEQRAIFQRFVRGAAARLHEIKGTGIGLAMVSNIVRAHGGKVLLKSTAGAGSTFTIVLPAGRRICHES